MSKKARAISPNVVTRTCLGLAVVSAVFLLAVGSHMLSNHLRFVSADPLNSVVLEEMKERLKEEQGNEALRQEIRELDLLARRAWHEAVAFNRSGTWLLLVGILVLVVSLKTLAVQRPKTRGRRGKSRTETASEEEQDRARATARWMVASMGSGIVAGAVIIMALSPSPFDPSAATDNQVPTLWPQRLEQWPSFRGPDGNARATEGNWPMDWDGGKGRNILFKVEVPKPGFSSPVVWGDRLFLTGGDDQLREVYCYDAVTRELQWRHEVTGIQGSPVTAPQVTEDTGHAAPTVATDGERVYAIFSTGDLVALDFDGNRKWAANLGVPDNPYGYASSLMVYKELVLVLYDQWDSARLLALEGRTGIRRWETVREMEASWSSPIIAAYGDAYQVVVSGHPYLAGYDPASGRELWRIEALGGEVASSPAYADGMVFAANEYSMLTAIDLSEGGAMRWQHEWDLPEVSGVLATGERVYMANGFGTLTCLRQETGEELWRHDFEEGFYSSPVLAGGNVYLMDRTGIMRIIRDGDQLELLASPALGEDATCTPAFVDGRIYIRGVGHLYCIGEEKEKDR